VKTALLRVGISNFNALLQLLSDTAFANKSSASRRAFARVFTAKNPATLLIDPVLSHRFLGSGRA
jgi:hypothetical protein